MSLEGKQSRPGYLTKYARHAGISVASASEALRRVGIDYMEPFDFSDADRRREAARHADRVLLSKPIYGQSDDDTAHADEQKADSDSGKPGLGSFSEEQTRERHFKAKLAELEYLERVKTLIKAEDVDKEWFRLCRVVRDSILNVPSRLSGLLVGQSDERIIHDLLEKELCQALEALANGMQTGADDCGTEVNP